MNVQTLRGFLPALQEELVLNMSYQTGGRYGVLAMLAKKDDVILLWEICNVTEEEQEERRRHHRRVMTNRQSLKENMGATNSLRIKSIDLEGTVLTVASATGTCLGDVCNEEERVHLIYFLQKGVRLGCLEEEPLERLIINCYEMREQEFPQIDTESIQVRAELSEQMVTVAVNKRISLKTGECVRPRLVKVKGAEEFQIYIHGVSYYDIWEEAKTRFEDKRYVERFSSKEIERVKKEYMKSLPMICPKGSVLPIVEYESEKDYQMQFYSLDYLRRVPENSATSMFMMLRPEKKLGPMGYRNRACALEAVEKGFEGNIEAELFSYYQRIPGKTVRCKKIV